MPKRGSSTREAEINKNFIPEGRDDQTVGGSMGQILPKPSVSRGRIRCIIYDVIIQQQRETGDILVRPAGWLVGWLFGWLARWLAGWLTG